MKRKIIAIFLIGSLFVLLYFAFSMFLGKPKAGSIKGQSNTITRLEMPGNATPSFSIIMDFSNCSRGSDVIYFFMGSTHFAFEGIKQDSCVFYYGTEIENPNWDRTLPFKCIVPKSLGKKTYFVGGSGIELQELGSYCVKL